MKNLQASIQAKLRNLANAEGKDFVLVSRLYMQEGVLRRISLSMFAESFCLKGGLLLYSISGFTSRPTQDIDLLGSNIPRKEEQIKDIMEEILLIQVDDGLVFTTNTMILREITEGADYQGKRLKVECKLGNIRTNLKLDIGFGDIIYPGPVQMDYPTLLKNNTFKITAYSLESVIAEKFEAMIVLDSRNSRMKDFYDVYDLLTMTSQIKNSSLSKAIKLTLQRRKTNTPKSPAIFQESFANNPRNLMLWNAFLSRIKSDDIDFILVMKTIKDRLEPIYRGIIK